MADRKLRRDGGRGAGIEYLVQVARLGLVKAVNRFDPAIGWNFVALAAPTMIDKERRHFRDPGRAMHVPRRLDRHTAITPTPMELTHSLGAGAHRRSTGPPIST